MPSDEASEEQRRKYRAELEARMALAPKLDQTGQCLCGAVKFSAKGPIRFSNLCHCKSCVRFVGAGPVHLVGLNNREEGLTFTEGEDAIRIVKGHGVMRHAFCSQCGGAIYQWPEGADFCGLFPSTFRIEQGDRGCALPDELKPVFHINYENRMRDHEDGLVKWKVWPNGERLNNDGTAYIEAPARPPTLAVVAGVLAATAALGLLVSRVRK